MDITLKETVGASSAGLFIVDENAKLLLGVGARRELEVPYGAATTKKGGLFGRGAGLVAVAVAAVAVVLTDSVVAFLPY